MDSSRINERLSSIEARLSQIEGALRLSPPRPVPSPDSGPWSAAQQQAAPQPSPRRSPAPVVTGEAKSGNWLGGIAIVCFILAAGFIIKLSIETGWLTPARQMGLAEADGTMKPAGSAYAFLEGWLPGKKVDGCAADAGGFWSCTVSGADGYRARALWRPEGPAPLSVPAGWGVQRVLDLQGGRREIAGAGPVIIGQVPLLLEN